MAVEIVMPKLGMVMSEGTLAKWSKAAGDRVARGDVVAEIETEKLNYDLEAAEDGILHHAVSEGAVVPVEGIVGYLLAEGEPVPEVKAQPAPSATPEPRTAAKRPTAVRPPGGEVRSTPGARKLAAKLGVDLSQATGTGPGGRVVEDDVRRYHEQAAPAPAPALPPGLPEPSKAVAMEGVRKRIAEHMRESISATAQLSFFLELDVTEAQRLRKDASSGGTETITMANVLTKACAETLKRHPEHSTVLSDGKVLYFDEINIGLAVALKEGLIVPVLSRVDQKSLFDISKETNDLAAAARDGKLLPDDLSGGTFTISVLGSVDGFTPILNAGQSAILGVGRSVEKPVVRRGEVVVREMMTVSLTVDHQVIDGALAAGFLRRLQQTVERPAALFK